MDQIITKWVKEIGLGFDPLLHAKDYEPSFDSELATQYDADMNQLWAIFGTNGELEGAIIEEMQRQNLI